MQKKLLLLLMLSFSFNSLIFSANINNFAMQKPLQQIYIYIIDEEFRPLEGYYKVNGYLIQKPLFIFDIAPSKTIGDAIEETRKLLESTFKQEFSFSKLSQYLKRNKNFNHLFSDLDNKQTIEQVWKEKRNYLVRMRYGLLYNIPVLYPFNREPYFFKLIFDLSI